MKYRSLFVVFVLLVILSVAACDAVEPVPTLPPPPTSVNSDQPPAIVIEGGAVPAGEGEARETAVANSSPTPVETPTLAPTVTPTEAPDPAIDPAQMPAISHDLLFVGHGKLKRWRRDGNVVTLLDGDVVDYSLSKDGRRVVVSQLIASTEISNTVTAVMETIDTYSLTYLNLETGGSKQLISDLNNMGSPDFQLSQDGNHLAVSGLGLGDPESLTLGEDLMAELYVMETETGQTQEKVGDCAGECQHPLWHQDNNFFVFGNDTGLFLKNLAGKEPELLLSGDDGTEYGRHFEPLSWAKNGRWLLLRVEDMNGTDHYVFDIPTKQLIIVPYTNSYDGFPYADVTWMQDDRLFMVRNEGDPVVGETWRVNMDAGEIQRDESIILSEENLRPWAPIHWANGRFGYGLLDMNGKVTELYQRVAFNEPAELMNVVPDAASNLSIIWAPDGSGAVVHLDDQVYYAPADGELVDLETAVGLRGHNFTWLP